jgi:hypothetical protein
MFCVMHACVVLLMNDSLVPFLPNSWRNVHARLDKKEVHWSGKFRVVNLE